MSIRRRLLLIILSGISLVWLGSALLSYLYTRSEVDELFNHQLQLEVSTLDQLNFGQVSRSIVLTDEQNNHEDRFAVYIWDNQGHPIYASPGAPPLAFAPQDQVFVEMPNNWRAIRAYDEDQQRWLAVARQLTEREEVLVGLQVGLLLPWVFSFLAVIWLVYMAISNVMQRFAVITEQVKSRKLDDLSSIDLALAPVEIRPLVLELNALLARLEYSVTNERRFTADAAHELRTPLAAIRVQAELALQTAQSSMQSQALQLVIQGVDRAAHTMSQMLQLARLDHLGDLLTMSDAAGVDVSTLVQLQMQEIADVAEKRAISLALNCMDPALKVEGKADLLMLAVRNLLDNAIAHTPEEGSVVVHIRKEEDQVIIDVCDSGLGVPPDTLPLLGERFYRLDPQRPGSGLGLSIVKRIVSLHGGSLMFSNHQGLCATIRIPLCH